jgi:hypothetical protein
MADAHRVRDTFEQEAARVSAYNEPETDSASSIAPLVLIESYSDHLPQSDCRQTTAVVLTVGRLGTCSS